MENPVCRLCLFYLLLEMSTGAFPRVMSHEPLTQSTPATVMLSLWVESPGTLRYALRRR